MDLPISLQDITYAENYLAQGDLATATPLLERLVELAEVQGLGAESDYRLAKLPLASPSTSNMGDDP